MMEIDEINLAIINHLRDGRMPFKKIADSLAVSEGTVRGRVKKLKEEGVLAITALVDPEAVPDHSIVMVGVRLKLASSPCCSSIPKKLPNSITFARWRVSWSIKALI
jgi:DNA-binding Lrp family transcriptional regulator